jgi:hypothetical protein
VNFPSKRYAADVADVRLVGNLFGQQFHPTCGSSGPFAGVDRFTHVAGNTFMDGRALP